jgi:hypothetical protein
MRAKNMASRAVSRTVCPAIVPKSVAKASNMVPAEAALRGSGIVGAI